MYDLEEPHVASTEATAKTPTIEAFVAEAKTFLAAWPVKRGDVPFHWGRGSDDVALFDEQDGAEEARLEDLRRYRLALADAGLAWISGPVAYGGRGLDRGYQDAFDALTRRYEVPSNAPLTIGIGTIAPTILTHGSEAAKRRYLWKIHTGELVACQLFSEPTAGSDLAGVATTARRDGDGWRINGQKVWTSGAHVADIGEVLVRTGAGPRHHNLTAFVIDMHAPGVDVRPIRQMTGGAAFDEVFLDNVWVPDDDRLGELDEGWRVALTTLSNERNALGGATFGGKGIMSTERLCALLTAMGRADDPLLRAELASLVSSTRVATWTRRRIAAERRTDTHAAMLKLALVRDMRRLSDLVANAVGAALTADTGQWGTFAWNGVVLGVPGWGIGGGTNEILKSQLAERALGLPKEPTA
jgi:alkylation response protein AidB-like acyl-CoA dehydrogenase